MEYSYISIDNKGIKQKGIIEANSEREVAEFLKLSNSVPVSIKRKTNQDILASLPFLKGVSSSDIVFFTRQLSSMILTGLTLLESLNILKKQTNNTYLANIITDLVANISEGKSFSQALQNHKENFSEVYIALVRAAETSGKLDKILDRLANNLERSEDLKKKIKSAMFYPLIIILGVIGVVLIMNIFVLPPLIKLYTDLNVPLHFATRLVVTMSNVITNFWWFLMLLPVGFYILFSRFTKTVLGIRIIDKLKIRIPIISGIATLMILSEVTRTLSILISSGNSIIEAINITSKVAGNVWYKSAFVSSAELVEKGIPLSTALEHQEIFPPVLIEMVKVGESTGRIDEGLERISLYFERDLDIKIKTLTTALEPILLIMLGSIVGFLIFSVLVPIYTLITSIQ